MALLTKRRFTVTEYHRMAAAGILSEEDRVELIEGEIVEMSPIGSRHAGQVIRLGEVLYRAAAGRATVSTQNPLRLDERSEPQPDVALLRPRPDHYTERHPEPADVLLVVEVADSSSDYDRQIKLPLYAQAGIPAVWLIDLAAPGVIEVYEGPSPHGFNRVVPAAAGERLGIPGLPGLSVEVGEIVG